MPTKNLFFRPKDVPLAHDMVNMEVLNEAEILSNIEKRFYEKKIYTMIGKIDIHNIIRQNTLNVKKKLYINKLFLMEIFYNF